MSGAARILAAVALALLAPAGSAAAAEGELGVFTWTPSLRVTAAVDDNLFYEDGGEDGGVGGWIAPRVELSYRRPALELGLDASVDVRRYSEGSRLDAELYRAVGWAEVGLPAGFALRASNAFVPQAVRLGLPEDEGRNLVQSNRSELGLRWGRAFDRGRELSFGVQGTYFLTEDYPEWVPGTPGPRVDRDYRADYAQGLSFVEFQSPLGERSTAFVRAQGSYRSFREDADLDHGNLSLLLGWRSSRFENLDLEIAGGAGALGFDRFGDELRALGRAHVRYRFRRDWTVSLAARHLDTPNLALRQAMESTGEFALTRRFGAATEAGLRVFVTRFDGDLRSGDANLFGAAELHLRRQLDRWVEVGLRYRHWRNAGALGADDFAQNRVLFELSLRR